MRLDYHPAVQADFNEALGYYEAAGKHLADRCEAEFQLAIATIKSTPRRFPFYFQSETFRRFRLKSFPFVMLCRERAGGLRVAVLKHEKRNPRLGLSRR